MLWTFIAVGLGSLAGFIVYRNLMSLWVAITWFVLGWKPAILVPSQVEVTIRDCSQDFMNHYKDRLTEVEIARYTRWVIETYVLNFYLPML